MEIKKLTRLCLLLATFMIAVAGAVLARDAKRTGGAPTYGSKKHLGDSSKQSDFGPEVFRMVAWRIRNGKKVKTANYIVGPANAAGFQEEYINSGGTYNNRPYYVSLSGNRYMYYNSSEWVLGTRLGGLPVTIYYAGGGMGESMPPAGPWHPLFSGMTTASG